MEDILQHALKESVEEVVEVNEQVEGEEGVKEQEDKIEEAHVNDVLEEAGNTIKEYSAWVGEGSPDLDFCADCILGVQERKGMNLKLKAARLSKISLDKRVHALNKAVYEKCLS